MLQLALAQILDKIGLPDRSVVKQGGAVCRAPARKRQLYLLNRYITRTRHGKQKIISAALGVSDRGIDSRRRRKCARGARLLNIYCPW